MPSFDKGSVAAGAAFGKNNYLRSTQDIKTEPATFAAASIPTELVTGTSKPQKVLQSGEVLAKITSGLDIGKVGVFQAGALDGRQLLANIVGVNDTFLPWQLLEHDTEVAYVYDAAVVQGWCTERDAAGARIVLTNTTAAAMFATKTLDILFH